MSISTDARVDALFKKLQGRTDTGLNTPLGNETLSTTSVYTPQISALPVPKSKPADLTPYPWIVRVQKSYSSTPGPTSVGGTFSYQSYSDPSLNNIISYYPITVKKSTGTELNASQFILDFDTGNLVSYIQDSGNPSIDCYVYSGATYDSSRLLSSTGATGLFVDASGSVGVGVAAVGTDSRFTPTNYTIDPSGSSFAVTVPSSSAAIKYAADISGNTHIAGNLLVRSLAFEESTFTVSGDIATFYPIVFVLPTVSSIPGPFNFTVYRTTNMNAGSRGGMMINVEGHPIYYGHNFPYLSWKFENTIQSGITYKYFVGNVELAEQNPAVILYLRGGQTSYKYYGTGIRAVLNATEVKTPLKLPEFTNTFTSKTTSDVTTSYFDFTQASGWYDSRCAMRSISYEGSSSNANTISAVGTYIGGTSGARAVDSSSVLRFVTVKGDGNFIQSGQNTTSGSSLPLKITTMSAGKTAMMVDPSAGYTYVSDRIKVGALTTPTQALDVAGNAVISGTTTLTGATTVSSGDLKANASAYVGSRLKIGSVVNGPSKTLDVSGDAVISNGITVTAGGLNITGTTALAGATTVSSGDLKANANAYVGSKLKIGSTSSVPAQALDVAGNATISGNLILNTLGNYSSPNIYWSGNATTGIYSLGTGVAMRSSAGSVAYVDTSGFRVDGGGLTVTTGGANITGQVNFNGTAPKGFPAAITPSNITVNSNANGDYLVSTSLSSAKGLYFVSMVPTNFKNCTMSLLGYYDGTNFLSGGAYIPEPDNGGEYVSASVINSTTLRIKNRTRNNMIYTISFRQIAAYD